MVKIRLMRVGKKKQPSYRVVVADSRSPRDGRIIEAIGHYRPRQEPSAIDIDNERALYWLQNGAQPSDSVRQILRISGAWSEFTGEAPITEAPPPKPKRATPAASVAAATAAEETTAEEPAAEEPAAEEPSAEQPEVATPAEEQEESPAAEPEPVAEDETTS